MKLPPFYTLFCAAVLALFAFAKVQGLAVLGASTVASSSRTGGYSSGISGSHK